MMAISRSATHQPLPVMGILALLFSFLLSSTTAAVNSDPSSSNLPLRLTVDGSQLRDSNGEEVRLTGFNWVLSHLHEGDGTYMQVSGLDDVYAKAVLLLFVVS